MNPARRILFGVVASLLLLLGLVKAAESFDPVFFGGQEGTASADHLGGSLASGIS